MILTHADPSIAKTTNTAAMIGLFCALFGLFLPAIVFGSIGMRESERRPNEDGGWIGFTSVMIGVIEAAVFLGIGLIVSLNGNFH